jgi:hypothetical protein
MPAFLFLTFFVFEIGIAVLWIGTVEKAAQLGARLAIVSNYGVTGLTPGQRNLASNSTVYPPGTQCATGCAAFASKVCSGGSGGDCGDGTGFATIFNRMDAIANLLQPANVTIRYEYVGLGFVGGPIIPRVTVTIGRVGATGQNVSFNTFTASILAGLIRLATGDPDADFPGLTVMPPITATFTGEDLSTAGAS